MKLKSMLIISIVIMLLHSLAVVAVEEHLLPLQGTITINGAKLSPGNLIIELYDAPTGGNLVYNSTNDFLNTVSGGSYDILLGNGTQPLSLNFGQKYYMDIYIEGTDVDFNGSERQVFMSTVGNISLTTPLTTTSTDTDDALNISVGGAFISGNFVINNTFNVTAASGNLNTAGKIQIENNDADDALNVTGGTFISGDTIINNFFNMSSTTSTVRTNGTLTITSLASPAFSLNGFNISGANAALETNGTVSLLSLISPAFSLNGFNISGADASLSTNGSINVNNLFNITASSGNTDIGGKLDVDDKVTLVSDDDDDALNITTGGVYVAGGATLANSVTLTTSKESGFLFNGFNISGADESLRTNGTISILNIDTDDALNVSGASMFRDIVRISAIPSDPVFTINNGFNISGSSGALTTNGTISILNADQNNAFTVTGGATILSAGGLGNFNLGNRGFVIDQYGGITTQTSIGEGGYIKINSNDPGFQAFSINSGFNVSGADASLSTNGSINVNNLFNVTASSGNTDIGGKLDVDDKVTLVSGDADDALNITTGSLYVGGAQIQIGRPESTTQHHLDLYDGGTDKCSYISLFDEAGTAYFLFVNATNGNLLMGTLKPFACDESEGSAVGTQT